MSSLIVDREKSCASNTFRGSERLVQLAISLSIIGLSGSLQIFSPGWVGIYIPVAVAAGLVIIAEFLSRSRGQSDMVVVLLAITTLTAFLLSTLESLDPKTTLLGSISLIVIIFLALRMARALSTEQILYAATYTFVGLLVVSVFLVIFFPHLGIDSDTRGDYWKGLFVNKNTFGRMACITLVLVIAATMTRNSHQRVFALFGTLLATACAWYSGSATSVSIGVFLAILYFLSRSLLVSPRSQGTVVISLAALSAGISLISFETFSPVFAFLGRDVTLTGRQEIWTTVLQLLQDVPPTGYGYAAFWSSDLTGSVVSRSVGFLVASAHNGFLDLWAQLGLHAALVVLIVMVLAVLRRVVRPENARVGRSLFLFVSLFFVLNLTESAYTSTLLLFLFWILMADNRSTLRVPPRS